MSSSKLTEVQYYKRQLQEFKNLAVDIIEWAEMNSEDGLKEFVEERYKYLSKAYRDIAGKEGALDESIQGLTN